MLTLEEGERSKLPSTPLLKMEDKGMNNQKVKAACRAIQYNFPIIVEHLQEEMRHNAMSTEMNINDLRIKYQYLDELIQLINNECMES